MMNTTQNIRQQSMCWSCNLLGRYTPPKNTVHHTQLMSTGKLTGKIDIIILSLLSSSFTQLTVIFFFYYFTKYRPVGLCLFRCQALGMTTPQQQTNTKTEENDSVQKKTHPPSALPPLVYLYRFALRNLKTQFRSRINTRPLHSTNAPTRPLAAGQAGRPHRSRSPRPPPAGEGPGGVPAAGGGSPSR